MGAGDTTYPHQIAAKVSAVMLRRIDEVAVGVGMKRAEWVRLALLRELQREQKPITDSQPTGDDDGNS